MPQKSKQRICFNIIQDKDFDSGNFGGTTINISVFVLYIFIFIFIYIYTYIHIYIYVLNNLVENIYPSLYE